MSLPHILLGLLREPASGYDLKAEFDEGIRHFWSAELSQIYPTLKRMQARGWLTSEIRPSDRGPDRRVYTRTDAGRAELHGWLSGSPSVGAERFAYLAQIAFMDELGDLRRTLEFMHALRARLSAWEAELRAIEAGVFAALPGYPDDLPPEALHHHLTLRMGLHTLAAKVTWCDETLARLERRLAASGSRPDLTPSRKET